MVVFFALSLGTCTTLYMLKRSANSYYTTIGSFRSEPKRTVLGFIWVFLILSIFSAIRDGIGCDYDSYMMHIHNIQAGYPNYMEVGFKWVCIQLSKIDNNPRLVIIVFSLLTVFFYTKAIWDQSDDVLLSVFLFLTWGYYFLTYNTIRNYFALALALYSIKYIGKKKYVHFIILVIIAALFHKSAIICIPLYLLANRKYSKLYILPFMAITIGAIVLRNKLRSLVFILYPGYLNSAYDVGRISYLNIVKGTVVIILCLLYFNKIKDHRLARLYFNLNVFSLMYYIGLYWTPEVSRIGFYMNATTIFLIPHVINSISNKKTKGIISLLLTTGSIALFALLCIEFYSDTMRLLPYKTWLYEGY